jgi:hypothetical protein
MSQWAPVADYDIGADGGLYGKRWMKGAGDEFTDNSNSNRQRC